MLLSLYYSISLCHIYFKSHSRKFSSLKDHSYTQTLNTKADSIARSARKQRSFVVHMVCSVFIESVLTKKSHYIIP